MKFQQDIKCAKRQFFRRQVKGDKSARCLWIALDYLGTNVQPSDNFGLYARSMTRMEVIRCINAWTSRTQTLPLRVLTTVLCGLDVYSSLAYFHFLGTF